MYFAAAYQVDSLQQALEGFLMPGAGIGAPFVIVSAMCGVSVRLYLLSSVGLDHPAAGGRRSAIVTPPGLPIFACLRNLQG